MSDVLALFCIIGAVIVWIVINELNYRRERHYTRQPIPSAPVIVLNRRATAAQVGRGAADSSVIYYDDEGEDEDDEPINSIGRRSITSTSTEPNQVIINVPATDQNQRQHEYIEDIGVLVDVFPWLGDVDGNDPRTGNHHTLIAGESDAGKSTLARAMLISRSYSGYVLVLNPHAKRDNWGVPAIGGGRNFEEINRAMELLLAEMDRRYDAPEGQQFESLSIFIDEWPAIKEKCPIASEFLKSIAMEGRKVRMRLVVLSQSRLLEDLGLKGSGDIKKSFSTVLLGTFAQQQIKQLQGLPYAGVLIARGQQMAMVTTHYPNLLSQRFAKLDHFYKLPGIEARSSWSSKTPGQQPEPTRERNNPASGFVNNLLSDPSAGKISPPSGKTPETFSGSQTVFPAPQRDFYISEPDFTPAQIAKIAAEIGRGEKGKTEIVKNMPGYSARRHSQFATYYDQLAEAINRPGSSRETQDRLEDDEGEE